MTEELQLEKLKVIIEKFETNLKTTTETALNSIKGGDENWYKLLSEHNIEPASDDLKKAYYNVGMPVEKGALPIELRKVYLSLRNRAVKEYHKEFGNSELDIDADLFWDDFLDRLRDFVEEEIEIYIGKIKQKVSVSNIFANAFSGMNKFSNGLNESSLNTKQCNSCGAPRLDKDQYDECYFCGTPLFETKKAPSKCEICGGPKFIEDKGKECQFCGN